MTGALPTRIVWGGKEINPASHTGGGAWTVSQIKDLRGAEGEWQSGKRVQTDGMWATTPYQGAMTGTLEGWCETRTEIECDRELRAIHRTMPITDTPLTIHEAAGPITVWVRRDGAPKTQRVSPTRFEWAASVVAYDPVWWLGDQTEDGGLDDSYRKIFTTGLPNRTGGLTFPITFPINFASTGTTGDMIVTLDGPARMLWRINGPLVNPRVAVTRDGVTSTVAWTLSMTYGEYLDVDPQKWTSKLMGEASRNPWLHEWATIDSAGDTQISFRADAYSADASMTAYIYPLA